MVSGVGLGEFEARVNNFSRESSTYVRAYVTNSKGTFYGNTIEIFSPDFIVIQELGIAVQRQDIGYGYWNSMNTLCKNSTVGGFTDWRLPTIDELAALYNLRDEIGGFTKSSDSYQHYYWSSTIYSSSLSNYHYYISFRNGYKNDKNSGSCSARAVRTLTK